MNCSGLVLLHLPPGASTLPVKTVGTTVEMTAATIAEMTVVTIVAMTDAMIEEVIETGVDLLVVEVAQSLHVVAGTTLLEG